MRRATENQGNTRTLTEYFQPRSKVKDLVLQQRSGPHFQYFVQETPMKPSQLPNRLSHPPARRMLPLQSPEPCHRDRLAPMWHPSHPQGPNYSSGFVPSGSSSGNRYYPTATDRLGPLQHHHHQSPGSFCSSRIAPVSPTQSCTTAQRPPSAFHPAAPQFMKDLNNHIRREQGSESYSGSKNGTSQRQEANKAQSSDVRSSIRTIQLQRPPLTASPFTRAAQDVCQRPPLTASPFTRAAQDVCPPLSAPCSPGNSLSSYQSSPSTSQSSHRSSGSSLPVMHSPVAPCQDLQHKQTPSRENLIPVVDLNCSSQKRRRDSEDCDESAKKLCLPAVNSGKVQTPKPTAGTSQHNTSLLSQTPSRHSSSGIEMSPKTTDSHLCTEPARGQSTPSSTSKPAQSSCASLSPNHYKTRPSMGAKQAFMDSTHSHVIELRSPTKKRSEDHVGSSPHVQLSRRHSEHSHHSNSVLPAKTASRGSHVEESRKSDSSAHKPASKTNSASSCRSVEKNKTRPRKPIVIPDDINDLFTPDPMTFLVSHGHKTAKPTINGVKSPTSEQSSSSSTSGRKTASPHAADDHASSSSSANQPKSSLPTVTLERVKLEDLKTVFSKDSELKNTSSSRQLKHESVKSDGKHTSALPNNVQPCASETSTASSRRSQSPPLQRQASEGHGKPAQDKDPIDVELDLGLSFELELDLSQSSNSSEDEQLLSLQEMMERGTKPPDTPEKGAFSEPSTPGHRSCQSKTQPLPATTKTGIYKNNLDQMLNEINNNKRAKEIEAQLLTTCQEDLMRIAEYEEAEENREEGVNTEQQKFLQRFSLMSNAIREVPPGEVVFNLEKFGRIFDHHTLELRRCEVDPQGTAQKTLLWSSPAQLRLHLNIGLFQEAYDCRSPCPTQVTRFLFKMMSVHSERMVSDKILQALCDIACTAAYQIVKNGSQQFKVWVPSLADMALVLMNMGVAFVTLFPFENLQPPFTEGDLLEDVYIRSESPSTNREPSTFPEHNCNNILKYLSSCLSLCPKAYSDDELLLLLTVVGRVGLDTRLILQSSVELYPLQYKIINNIRDWNTMLPRICRALTDLTDDHHNMCLLVQLLPDNTLGKQLRRHLSLSMISKLLDGNCTYRPTEKEFQLSELRPYLPRMQPSTLLRGLQSSSSRSPNLDQQSYYLCYSLLTLANEASNFQFFPPHQKTQLLFLSSELETHVKCDIRESEKCLYRSKVKDLVARIYTKWQMLLQRTRPLDGKLYDYWQPPVDTLTSGQEEQEIVNSDDGEGPVTENNDEEETNEAEAIIMISEDEKEEGDDTAMDNTNETMKPVEMEEDGAMGDTEEALEMVRGELSQEMPEMEPREAGTMERAEVETEH